MMSPVKINFITLPTSMVMVIFTKDMAMLQQILILKGNKLTALPPMKLVQLVTIPLIVFTVTPLVTWVLYLSTTIMTLIRAMGRRSLSLVPGLMA